MTTVTKIHGDPYKTIYQHWTDNAFINNLKLIEKICIRMLNDFKDLNSEEKIADKSKLLPPLQCLAKEIQSLENALKNQQVSKSNKKQQVSHEPQEKETIRNIASSTITLTDQKELDRSEIELSIEHRISFHLKAQEDINTTERQAHNQLTLTIAEKEQIVKLIEKTKELSQSHLTLFFTPQTGKYKQ